MLKIFFAAFAVTVKDESAFEAVPEELAFPNEVESLVTTKVVTRSSNKSSFKAATILSSESLITTSPE